MKEHIFEAPLRSASEAGHHIFNEKTGAQRPSTSRGRRAEPVLDPKKIFNGRPGGGMDMW